MAATGKAKLIRLVAWGGVAAILLAPLIAMQFTREVAWTPFDFLFAGALLIGGGLLVELALWRVRKPLWRAAGVAVVVVAVALIWAEGAVGIF